MVRCSNRPWKPIFENTNPKNRMKTQIKQLGALLILLLGTSQLWSQCRNFSYEYLDGNKVAARFTCGAERFWDLVNKPSYEVPRGSGKSACFAGSFWIGGLDTVGALHVAASTYRQAGDEFYAGPMRQGVAYNCGRGYTTPYDCNPEGALLLAGGKVANFYPNGFQVYDLQTQASMQRILPNDFLRTEALELQNGDLMLFSWFQSQNSRSLAMVFDANGFPMPQVDTLLFKHPNGAMTLLPNGKVLIADFNGIEIYDPVLHTSTLPAPIAVPALACGLTTMANGKVLLVAGLQTAVYDPILDSWTAGPATTNRFAPVLTNLPGGDVLITGGDVQSAATERYNPVTNTLTPGPNLPFAMRDHVAFYAGNQEILVSAGSPWAGDNDIYYVNVTTGATRNLRFPAAALPIAYDGTHLVTGFSDRADFVVVDPNTGRILDQRWQDVWKVSKVQVQQFQQDFTNQSINFANYPDIETWPGNGNVWAGEDAQLAPYIDLDNDGVYDPQNDGDYPCFPGDMALWWIFNDDGPHGESQGLPLGIQVENLSYIVDCNLSPCPDTALDYATFHHLEVTNHGIADLHDVYLGTFLDFDLGDSFDDFIGSDSALGLAFSYNGDANDDLPAGYGFNPPALGAMVLPNGQIDQMNSMMYWQNTAGLDGNPYTAIDFYNYLRATWKDGSHLLNNGVDGFQATGSGPATNFAFSGDPGFCGGAGTGWSEVSAANAPYDRRALQNYGPLNLGRGQEVVLDYAMVYARDLTRDNIGNVCKLKTDAATIQNWWATALDKSCFSIVTARPDPQAATAWSMELFPNPNAGNFELRLSQAPRRSIDLVLRNLQGQSVWLGQIPAGTQMLHIETLGLPSGLYLLQMIAGDDVSMHKVVIAH
jgi:hypothetical protein